MYQSLKDHIATYFARLRSEGERLASSSLAGSRSEHRKWRVLGFVGVSGLAAVLLLTIANPFGWFTTGSPVLAAEIVESQARASRSSCAEIGVSDLYSPAEGVWFQSNCLAAEEKTTPGVTDCNRTAVDGSEFRAIATGLYLFRQTPGAPAYIWYESTPNCFDLVSSRLVTAVCGDQLVTFTWDTRAACSRHGGVLATVNGR